MLRLVTVKRSIALVAAVLVVATVAVAVPTPAPQAATPVVRAAFYYPWYPNAWNQSGVDPFTNYQPSAGYYSSSDPTVIARQIAAMQYGHLDAGISSWWGQGSQEDSRGAGRAGRGSRHRLQVVAVLRAGGLRGPEREPDPERPELHQGPLRRQSQLPEHRRQAGHLRLRRPGRRLWHGPALEPGQRHGGVLHRAQGVQRLHRLRLGRQLVAPVRTVERRGPPGGVRLLHLARVLQERGARAAAGPEPEHLGPERARHGGQQRAAATGHHLQRVG